MIWPVAILVQSICLALNLALIERGMVFDTDATGVSWFSVFAALLIAGCMGFTIRGAKA
jgi:hypothetical protein